MKLGNLYQYPESMTRMNKNFLPEDICVFIGAKVGDVVTMEESFCFFDVSRLQCYMMNSPFPLFQEIVEKASSDVGQRISIRLKSPKERTCQEYFMTGSAEDAQGMAPRMERKKSSAF